MLGDAGVQAVRGRGRAIRPVSNSASQRAARAVPVGRAGPRSARDELVSRVMPLIVYAEAWSPSTKGEIVADTDLSGGVRRESRREDRVSPGRGRPDRTHTIFRARGSAAPTQFLHAGPIGQPPVYTPAEQADTRDDRAGGRRAGRVDPPSGGTLTVRSPRQAENSVRRFLGLSLQHVSRDCCSAACREARVETSLALRPPPPKTAQPHRDLPEPIRS